MDDAELAHPRIIRVRVVNTGKREIRPDDFYGRAQIITSPQLVIKSAYPIRNKIGMATAPDCFWQDNVCTLKSVLYNRGDWVDIQLVVDTTPAGTGIDPSLDLLAHMITTNLSELTGFINNPSDKALTVESVIAGQTRVGKRVAPSGYRKYQLSVSFIIGICTSLAAGGTVTLLLQSHK